MSFLLAALLLQQEPPKGGIEAGYDEGFYLKGKDAKFTVEGLMQTNATAFERGAAHDSEFILRRMRLDFSGEFFDRWLFHFEPNFKADGVEMEEAWVGLQAGDHRFMFGRMKEPFELEEMSSTRHLDPINFSILNQFAPSEDHGITVFGSFGILEYGAGFYNGTGGDDTNSDKDGALRLVLHPWRGLQFGGSATLGREKIDIGREEIKNEARVAWAEYVPGTEVDGKRTRWDAEAAFLEGPFALTSDVLYMREELNDTPVRLAGGYVQASYVLTGEAKTFHGVKPEHPFLRDPDIGAWQLVGRWSRLRLDDDFIPFLTAFPGRIDSLTFGINWYANDFATIKLNYLHTEYRERIVVNGNAHDNEDALLFQFQVQF